MQKHQLGALSDYANRTCEQASVTHLTHAHSVRSRCYREGERANSQLQYVCAYVLHARTHAHGSCKRSTRSGSSSRETRVCPSISRSMPFCAPWAIFEAQTTSLTSSRVTSTDRGMSGEQSHTYAWMCIYIYIYICTYIHTYVHTRIPSLPSAFSFMLGPQCDSLPLTY